MGKRQGFPKKRGLKRCNNKQEMHKKAKISRKNQSSSRDENLSHSPTASDASEEQLDGFSSEEDETLRAEEEEVVVYKEPTMYDNLLKTLGSGSDSFASVLKRRQKEEEGQSDTEEDSDDDDPGTVVAYGEEDEGSDHKPSSSHDVDNTSQGSDSAFFTKNKDDAGTDDEDVGASDTDEESNLRVNGKSVAKTSAETSVFYIHLGYKLSKAEKENLLKRKWNYKWEMPAFDLPNCKWRGTGECFLKDSDMVTGYSLKPRLYKHWLDAYREAGGSDFHLSKQRLFFSICNSYRDILHHNKKPFYLKGPEEDSSVMDAYVIHSLNHIFRTRDLVTKNDARMAKLEASSSGESLNNENFLDQGFTRPKVLILLPLASIALRVVRRMIQLTPSKHKFNVEHMDRFLDEFGAGGTEEDAEGDFENSVSNKPSKPSDFRALFGGNNNDHFMVGIKYTRRNIKLYGDFYSSDIIVASPLGLITKIGEAETEKEKDVDYLSSIEVLIIDHADVIVMQNWSHVNTVVEHLNRIPSKQHGTNIMRIRPWYLDAEAQFYRQTIILGSHLNPEIHSLFNHHCLNYRGKVKLAIEHKGVLPKVLLQVRQIYERFDAESIVGADDARLEYFSKKVFPKIKDSVQGGIMIFISSYFEFVRLRNFLKSQEASLCLLGEYTKQSDISRARVWFFQGQRKIMLYSERAHFYHRYKIRGIQNIIIYSLPERREFYPEIVNMLEGSHSMTCTALFSRFDQLRLERIVGSAAAKRMVTSDKGVFVFC